MIHPCEDVEVAGILYASHTASKGQVVWYSSFDREGDSKITFILPAEYATAELYDRLEAAVRATIADHEAEHPRPPRAQLRLVG